MAVIGEIAKRAQGFLPETWAKLGDPASGSAYGDDFLQGHVDSVMKRYLGAVILVDDQEQLPEIVLEFLGLKLAIRLIPGGIDFWSKQAVQMGATGRNEQKTWAKRSEDLHKLRDYLTQEADSIQLDAEALLPSLVQVRPAAAPTVVNRDTTSYTPDPDSFEPVFDRTREVFGPRSS